MTLIYSTATNMAGAIKVLLYITSLNTQYSPIKIAVTINPTKERKLRFGRLRNLPKFK
jgi:hypothetical protein